MAGTVVAKAEKHGRKFLGGESLPETILEPQISPAPEHFEMEDVGGDTVAQGIWNAGGSS
jgi:hypothetical protein